MSKLKTPLAGWGNYPITNASVSRPEKIQQIQLDHANLIARGLGRSYGDAALNAEQDVLLTERLNRFLAFDQKKGIVKAEAGVTFADFLETFVPRGWFPPVTPGTKFVTLGGCLAADVHGKNHHRDGTISQHVKDILLLTANGTKLKCSPQQNADIFWATMGGMGLTGIITEASLQLSPIQTAYMVVKNTPAENLDAALQILENSKDERYSVAWIDCLSTGKDFGRSIVMNGRHADIKDLPANIKNPLILPRHKNFSIPFNMPAWLLNFWSIKLFNHYFYKFQSRSTSPIIQDYDHYFYPLDWIFNWNRLYGKKGFIQYQLVLPPKTSREGLKAILELLTQNKLGSFLAVLKRFGPEGQGILSFPREGYTLALDIPIKEQNLFTLLNKLDELVLKYEGRVYLAKDARMKPEIFRAMYPRYERWQQIKAQVDPKGIFSSDLSRRLHIEGKR